MLGENAPSALPCYVPPVTHYLILGTIGAAVFFNSPDFVCFQISYRRVCQESIRQRNDWEECP
jgi:hypothetical protein